MTDLGAAFDLTQPALSQHLRVLREAGLVRVRKEGRRRFYRLEASPLRALYDWAEHFAEFWPGRLAALGTYLDALGSADPGSGGAKAIGLPGTAGEGHSRAGEDRHEERGQ